MTTALLRPVEHETLSTGRSALLRRVADAQPLVLPLPLADRLDRWATFMAPTDACSRLGLEPSVVATLERQGWLEGIDEVAARVVDAAGSAAATPVTRVVVPTRGPGPHLHSLALAWEEDVERVVYVDDPRPDAADAVRRQLGSRGPVLVIGASERSTFVERLVRATGDRAAVEAALVAPPDEAWRIGALRNLVLLHGVGRGVLSVDDDIIAEGLHEGPDGTVCAGSALDPTTWRACDTRSDAWSGASPLSLAARAGQVLGRTAAGLLAPGVRMDDPQTTLGMGSPTLLRRVVEGERIVVASFGLAGDSAMGRVLGWLGAPSDARQHMLDGLPNRLSSRALQRRAGNTTVTDSPWFMSACFAFDGTAELAPFLPLGRNTDGLWGFCQQRVLRSGLVAHLPVAVRHDPATPRNADLADLAREAVTPRPTDLLLLLAAEIAPSQGTPWDRLAALAHHVRCLARAPDRARNERLEALVQTWRLGQLALLERARSEGGPEPWRRALDAAMRAGVEALALPRVPATPPLQTVLLERLGTVLDAWPALVSAARGEFA